MFQTIQTKLLLVIVVLLAGISSYLAYEHYERVVEEQKTEKSFERMRTEAKKEMPSGWAKSLRNK
jgi:hypothetical protein